MTAKVKSVLTVASEALETAAGYALVAVGLYSAIFVDITGSGSLWRNLRNMEAEGHDVPSATRVIKVPTQAQEDKHYEDRMLAVFDNRPAVGEVAAVVRAPDAVEQRSAADMTDSPADEQAAAKPWKKSLKGELRSFTVYGQGEQTTSASASAAPASVQENVRIVAVSGAPAAAAASAPAAARPGMGSRLSHGALSDSGSSRNIR